MKNPLRRATGFTLTELVLVIVIAGILSAVVYNKVDVNSFKAEGSTDEVKAALRYAQKLAVAQRRNVFITVSSTNVCVGYDAGCTSKLKKPATTDDFDLAVTGGVSSTAAAFNFDSQGRPVISGALATTAIALTFASRTVNVEPQTGFVH